MVVKNEKKKKSLYRSCKGEGLVIPPGQSFGSGTFSIKKSPLKRYLSDILNLTIFSPKETVML